MSRVAPIVPAESDILCEACGYTLNGLPEDGRCPECGKPIAESVDAARMAPAWEHREVHRPAAFVSTTAAVIFKTTAFYRTLATRLNVRPAHTFARLHWILASILLGATGVMHLRLMGGLTYSSGKPYGAPLYILVTLTGIIVIYLFLSGITWLAAKLTNWEATYRGLRLPISVVLRGMYYHAAHYLPVALLALATVNGYCILRYHGVVGGYKWDERYLYFLGGEIVVAAIYLFQTYWIGMRNMMYANR
jgi:hypothetical protein